MKKTLSIVIIAVALLASGCTPYTAPAEGFVFSNKTFSISLPAEFTEQNGVLNAKDRTSFNQIVFDVNQREKMTQAQLLEWETNNLAELCRDTDACGTIMNSENVTIDNVNGIKFLIQYQGRSIDDLTGSTNEYHYYFSNESNHVRFWTSAADPEDKDAIEKQFDEIINTIEFK